MITELNVYCILLTQKNGCSFKQTKGFAHWSRVIQHIIYTAKIDAAAVIYYIYEEWKETVLEFYKGKKNYVSSINGWTQ